MKFKQGEKVGFLNESGEGKVLQILSDTQLLITDEHGFERIYETNDLVKKYGNMNVDEMNIPVKDQHQPTKSASYSIMKEKSDGTPKKDFWELDLHIEQLTDTHKGLSNFEILAVQMKKFRQFLDKAKANHLQKVVVIHGVGEGVLKNEIRTFLQGSPNQFEFFDASYIEYGKGATEIRIRYNF